MRFRSILSLGLLGMLGLASSSSFDSFLYAQENLLIADFESDTYGDWIVTGEAFGKGPARGTLPGQMRVSGFRGERLVNSFHNGDRTEGTLASPIFQIDRKYISFLIGGGKNPEHLALQLLVDGVVVRSATGSNDRPGGSEELQPEFWDVAEFHGKKAQIRIVDSATGGWGHINVDHIEQTDTKPPANLKDATLEFSIEKRYLLLPIQNDAKNRVVHFNLNGKPWVRNNIELAVGSPDWWAPVDLADYQGGKISLTIDSIPENASSLTTIHFANEIWGVDPLYQESMRGQFHFSPARGWNNDPNGLVYYNGEYHLFFQHNPYGWRWGNMHWGHAVSKDLVHWRELGDKLLPDSMGPMYSGSAVVDTKRTSGLGKDGSTPMVLFYTAAGKPTVQGLAWSDDGRRFHKLPENPILGEVSPGNRDPKVIWHEASQRWIMVLYVELPGKQHSIHFYSSSDLRGWNLESITKGGIDGDKYLYECPDFFPLSIDGNASQTKWVLLGADGQYAIGNFDGKSFTPEHSRLLGHRGRGFYAAQSFSDIPRSDGRRILIGWFQTETAGMPFNQSMTIPLELRLVSTVAGPRLSFSGVRELQSLRSGEPTRVASSKLSVGDVNQIREFASELMEVSIAGTPSDDAMIDFNFRGTTLRYDQSKKKLTGAGIEAPLNLVDGKLQLHVYVDRTGLEIFADGGLVYIPLPVNALPADRQLSLSVAQGSLLDWNVEAYPLRSAWQE